MKTTISTILAAAMLSLSSCTTAQFSDWFHSPTTQAELAQVQQFLFDYFLQMLIGSLASAKERSPEKAKDEAMAAAVKRFRGFTFTGAKLKQMADEQYAKAQKEANKRRIR